jgi:hypothetical protein
LAFGMDKSKRDPLKSVSHVATKVVAKSADLFSQIPSINSGDPGDIARTGAGPSQFPAKETGPVYGGTLIKHSAPRSVVDVLTGLRDA